MEQAPNHLEAAFAKAAADPAERPVFYRLLVESQVFALGHTDDGFQGSKTAAAGETVSLINWQKDDGTTVIPFFTSLDALSRAIQEERSYIAMPARAFLEMTKGATLVLNPGLIPAKEFLPHEVESMLTTGVNQAPQRRVIQQETQVLLGQPADYPTKMVTALRSLFAKHPCVRAAYLGLMHDPSTQEKPNLVVGVEGESGIERAIQDAGSIVSDTVPDGGPVDFVRVAKGEVGLSDYFTKSVKPFYERSWSSKLKSLFGLGGC